MTYEYYDEAYFQSGASKGTVYSDYLNQSRSSAIYREIADAIATVFRPTRALEVGCATGVIVSRLNGLGVEAHGIDVSEWAIEHREHPNVTLSGVERLAYPDGHFDLTYSVHSLEHVPEPFKDAAFSELARVSRGVQFHMLPMVGVGPYAGDPAAVVAGLRRDPTHHLLETREWWLRQFAHTGFQDWHQSLMFVNEAREPDLGVSQLILSRERMDDALKERLRDWNLGVLQSCFRRAQTLKAGLAAPLGPTDSVEHRAMRLAGDWNDVEFEPSGIALGPERSFHATVAIRGDAPIPLRFCFITQDGAEWDLWREYPPGITQFTFAKLGMQQRKPGSDHAPIARMLFGGSGRGDVDVMLAASNAAPRAM